MPKPVVHFEICGSDYQKTKQFYGELFEWSPQEWDGGGMPYGMVEAAGDRAIGGGLMATDGKFPTYVTFYVQVDDLQAYLDKAEKLGGKTIMPPTPIPGVGASAMFADPDGNMIGLFKQGE
ncbi:MAG: VOC family protein [Candidatus Zixiibacteriota bacterium]|nr:MAG: VOC family protein [candidate division Zixibacteria bacterium]